MLKLQIDDAEFEAVAQEPCCHIGGSKLPAVVTVLVANVRDTPHDHPRDADLVGGGSEARTLHFDGTHAIMVLVGELGCGYCANLLIDETNSLRATHPHIAAEVNEALSGGRTADNVVAGSEFTMTFTCALGHDYETTPANRTRGSQCLVCTHQVVHPSTCLATVAPAVAAMWHDTMNGDLTPWDVFPGSMAKAWWKCPNGCDYDGAIAKRVEGVGCRYCSNRAVSKKNCMRVTRPDLTAEFHPWKNNERTPDNLVAGTSHKLWWLCVPHGHDWEASGDNRVRQGTGCPYCSNKKVWVGFNDMATTRPDLAADFHSSRNGDLTPQDVVAGTGKRLWWECQSCGHEWPATGDSRANKGRGCKKCARLDR